MTYCFGIDVGGTTVKMGLFQTDGTLVDKWEIKSKTEDNGSAILPDIATSINNKLAERNLDLIDMIGIGIGVPAPVTADGVVNGTANLGWNYKDVRHELTTLTGIDVKVGNDANVAALGEMWKGGGIGHKNMILITLGTGLGGGIIINGQELVGEHGAGGEIGHMTVKTDEEEPCGCGRKGCLEEYTSATGIVRLANRRLLQDNNPSTLREESISAKAVFDAVKEGDAVAIEIASEFGQILGKALINIAVLTDPSVIVIGGGVSNAGEILFDFIEPPFKENSFFGNTDTKFTLAQLGNDAGMYGAAKLILNA